MEIERSSYAKTLLGQAAAVLGLLVVWALVSRAGIGNGLLATPAQTARSFGQATSGGLLQADVASTLFKWLMGFIIGAVGGVLAGITLGGWAALRTAFLPVMNFFRSVPVTASYPLFLIAFGIGDASKIAMAGVATLFPVAVATIHGLDETPATRARALRVYGATQGFIITRVAIWQALPFVASVLRTTISLSLVVTVVAEMFLGSGYGIGQRIFEAFQNNDIPRLYVYLLLSGALGVAANEGFAALERATRKRFS